MEEHKKMHESLGGDAMSEITSPSAQSHSIRLSLDLSRQRIFLRTASMGSIGVTGSWRLGSIRPNLIIEGIPTNAITPAGTDGDRTRAVDIDENDLRPGSLCRMSTRGSWQSSVSFSSEHGDKVTLPQELVDRVDSSLAQVGCRGTRIGDKENEDGLLAFADDALILSFDSQSKVVSLPSNVTPLSDEIMSPLPTDPMMSTKGNNQISCTDKQYKLPFLLDYISYLSHLSVFGILWVKIIHCTSICPPICWVPS
ncbi:uncharacterized protein LOC122055781 isoform X2 [Zingiber officinale]|uniref:uncharacterized protein LOC122055781 isoform X2 n=1 Tax=Zingiber officinale TaxID=94328 RepID=UPI001C4B2A89|nr:uncharacterized protein LOC122055781 isoform X2 [Zingiber officinale]